MKTDLLREAPKLMDRMRALGLARDPVAPAPYAQSTPRTHGSYNAGNGLWVRLNRITQKLDEPFSYLDILTAAHAAGIGATPLQVMNYVMQKKMSHHLVVAVPRNRSGARPALYRRSESFTA